MARVKIGNIKGPKGDTGPTGNTGPQGYMNRTDVAEVVTEILADDMGLAVQDGMLCAVFNKEE